MRLRVVFVVALSVALTVANSLRSFGQTAPASPPANVGVAAPLPPPAPSTTPVIPYVNADMGLTYTPLAGSTVLDMSPVLPALALQSKKTAASDDEKKGMDCVRFPYASRTPEGGVVMVFTLTSSCLGTDLSKMPLGSLALGMSMGLKTKLIDPEEETGAYSLGAMDFAVLREVGLPKDNPASNAPQMLGVTCTIIGRNLAGFVIVASGQQMFDQLAATQMHFAGSPEGPLIPPGVLKKKPAASEWDK